MFLALLLFHLVDTTVPFTGKCAVSNTLEFATGRLNLCLSHLQAELARVDLLLRRCALRLEGVHGGDKPAEPADPADLESGSRLLSPLYAWQVAPDRLFAEDAEWTAAYAAAVQRSA